MREEERGGHTETKSRLLRAEVGLGRRHLPTGAGAAGRWVPCGAVNEHGTGDAEAGRGDASPCNIDGGGEGGRPVGALHDCAGGGESGGVVCLGDGTSTRAVGRVNSEAARSTSWNAL